MIHSLAYHYPFLLLLRSRESGKATDKASSLLVVLDKSAQSQEVTRRPIKRQWSSLSLSLSL
jgi:hypothetical protein